MSVTKHVSQSVCWQTGQRTLLGVGPFVTFARPADSVLVRQYLW